MCEAMEHGQALLGEPLLNPFSLRSHPPRSPFREGGRKWMGHSQTLVGMASHAIRLQAGSYRSGLLFEFGVLAPHGEFWRTDGRDWMGHSQALVGKASQAA